MTRRLGQLSGIIAAGVAIVGTGSVVMATSYSAFSTTTNNPTSSWSTGTVSLLDDDSGSALFSGVNQLLSTTATKCIKVTSNSTIPSAVKLYSTGFTDTNSLGSHILLTINVGTAVSPGTFSSCGVFVPTATPLYVGTLAGFNSTYGSSYSTGLPTGWTTTAGSTDSRAFQFIWSYDLTAPQSSSASDSFTWEAQG